MHSIALSGVNKSVLTWNKHKVPLDPHKVKYLKSDDQTRSDPESFVRGVQRFFFFFFFFFLFFLLDGMERGSKCH